MSRTRRNRDSWKITARSGLIECRSYLEVRTVPGCCGAFSVITIRHDCIGAANIANRGELARRFGDLFDRDTNAALCFTNKEPTIDTESANRYAIACPNKDDNFVVYEFERSRAGWKFIHREFPTKCGCR